MAASTLLYDFSNEIAGLVDSTRANIVAIRNPVQQHITGFLWQRDVVVTSEQAMGKRDEYDVVNASGETTKARIVGRDPATNVLALRTENPFATNVLEPVDTMRAGAIALAIGATLEGASAVRLGVIGSVGSEWQSRLGGRIDRRIALDIRLGRTEEGGLVLDAHGGVLGMSTFGFGDQVIAIPLATVERIVPQLLERGEVARGWLGVGLQPVAVPDALRHSTGQSSGMMVMSVAEGPATRAGVVAGDILLTLDGIQLRSMRHLYQKLDAESVGREAELTLIRGGEIKSLRITPEVRPKS